ncbi:MAG: hypothetical protein CDV28_10445 [Candidatus Electronema aureum]|uniref:DUF5329 domain-containing protein n=1 Tax=Candidatus Electronema aureum TaxID=2005002 RepID=A0A521G3W0_9BACT|nr:MAG: hypothetical protein CDV28_10445 [Candidatus Electronema aureum]
MKKFLFIALLILPITVSAQQLSPQSSKEIDMLIKFVQTSPCRFNRNGSWYSTNEAAEHISDKYHYALDRGLIHSAEDFINAAADKSSLSGMPYKVQCQGSRVMRSADWLIAELRRIRKQ